MQFFLVNQCIVSVYDMLKLCHEINQTGNILDNNGVVPTFWEDSLCDSLLLGNDWRRMNK